MTVLAPLLALGLAAAAPDPGVLRVATPGLAAGEDVTARQASLVSNALERVMTEQGARVAGPAGGVLERVLGTERVQAMQACPDSACVVNAAGPLDVDALVVGKVVRNGMAFRAYLYAFTPGTGALLAQRKLDAAGDLPLMKQVLDQGPAFVTELARAAKRTLYTGNPYKVLSLAPTALGLGLTGAGAALLVSASQKHEAVRAGGDVGGVLSPLQAQQLARTGQRDQLVGGALLALAGVSFGTAMYLFFQGTAAPPPFVPVLAPGPRGAQLAVTGRLP